MKKNYPSQTSLWIILIMFSLWFLIIPLIIGIIMLSNFNKRNAVYINEMKSNINILEEELSKYIKEQESLKALESELKYKKEELIIKENNMERMVILKTKEKEEQLFQREQQLLLTKLKLEKISDQQLADLKQKEKSFSEREQQLRLNYEQKEKEITNQKRQLEKMIPDKLKISRTLDFSHQISMIPKIREKEAELQMREQFIKSKEQKVVSLNQQIVILNKKKLSLEDELLYESFGFYDEKFSLKNSKEYLHFLGLVRLKQKQLVKEKRAWAFPMGSMIYSTNTETKKTQFIVKLAIRSFNSECDSAIRKVKFNNVEVAEKKIRSSFHEINKLNNFNSIEITHDYLNLKLEELFLVHEYNLRKQEEFEEQRRINDLIREEKRVQKELEEELMKIKKEEQHLLNVISQRVNQLTDLERTQYQNRLEEIREQKQQVDYRVKNTKAGYVYIISNIGCFGEDVFKIGMTRRLDPMDRVKELGGASVPFHFDVHAVIFSEDAPSLEAKLHRTFQHRRVNRINERKEFFRVTLNEIKKIVHSTYNSSIEFTMIAEAKEYRETQMLEKKKNVDV